MPNKKSKKSASNNPKKTKNVSKNKVAKEKEIATKLQKVSHKFDHATSKKSVNVWETYDLIKEKPKNFFRAMTIDFLFAFLIIFFPIFLAYNNLNGLNNLGTKTVSIILSLYLLFALIIYSSFKKFVLNNILQYFHKKHKNTCYLSFFTMNLLLFLLATLTLGAIMFLMNENPLMTIVFIVALSIFFLWTTLAHSRFGLGDGFKSLFSWTQHIKKKKFWSLFFYSFLILIVISFGLMFMLDTIFKYLLLGIIGLSYNSYYIVTALFFFFIIYFVIGYLRILILSKIK